MAPSKTCSTKYLRYMEKIKVSREQHYKVNIYHPKLWTSKQRIKYRHCGGSCLSVKKANRHSWFTWYNMYMLKAKNTNIWSNNIMINKNFTREDKCSLSKYPFLCTMSHKVMSLIHVYLPILQWCQFLLSMGYPKPTC